MEAIETTHYAAKKTPSQWSGFLSQINIIVSAITVAGHLRLQKPYKNDETSTTEVDLLVQSSIPQIRHQESKSFISELQLIP